VIHLGVEKSVEAIICEWRVEKDTILLWRGGKEGVFMGWGINPTLLLGAGGV
jgi:hypothetical protein